MTSNPDLKEKTRKKNEKRHMALRKNAQRELARVTQAFRFAGRQGGREGAWRTEKKKNINTLINIRSV